MTSLDLDVAPLQFIDLAGYRMAYRQWGAESATRATVLVHGITSLLLAAPAFPWPHEPEELVDRLIGDHLQGLLP